MAGACSSDDDLVPTLGGLIRECAARFAASGVDSPSLSARMLAGHALGLDSVQLIANSNRPLSQTEQAVILALAERRERGEPAAYILGRKEFYGLEFTVTPDTLIPRPETERIVELVLERHDPGKPWDFADWGTGSGILATVIACYLPLARGVAVDISPGALAVARENLNIHLGAGSGREERVLAVRADFTAPLFKDRGLDFIVSNPPYVSQAEYDQASREVTRYEPVGALVSGPDGGDHIRLAGPLMRRALKPGGRLFMEIGCDQARLIRSILLHPDCGFEQAVVHKDLAGLDRIVEAS